MAKVTPLTVAGGTKNLGTFKIEKFNMFEAEDLERYAELRNAANDASSGVKIEMMREYTRKRTKKEGAGEEQIVQSWEDIILVVQYWEKDPQKISGGVDDGIDKALASAAK